VPRKHSFAHFAPPTQVANEKGDFICVGTSGGTVNVFSIFPNEAKHDCSLDAHECPITALASEIGTLKTMASADHSGKIVTWASPSFEKESVFAGEGNTVTGLAFKDDFIIAALASGTIRLLNAKTAVAIAEIGGHSRIINAIDVHPVLDMFVTVGEDTFVNVWTLPSEATGQEISVTLNAKVDNAFLTGVRFCGPNMESIAATSYDLDQATIFDKV